MPICGGIELIVKATKIHGYNASLFSFPLHGLEIWEITEMLVRKIEAFDSHFLQMIKCDRWQEHVTNSVIYD